MKIKGYKNKRYLNLNTQWNNSLLYNFHKSMVHKRKIKEEEIKIEKEFKRKKKYFKYVQY